MSERPELRIEAFGAAHLEPALVIERLSFSDPWTRGMFRSELSLGEFAYCRVALEEDRVVGYLMAVLIPEEAHLGNLAVHPRTRRRGVAQSLLDDLLAAARNAGADRVTLEVRESNIEARKFYAKNKFIDVAIRKNYYRNPIEDAIVMLRGLREDSSG